MDRPSATEPSGQHRMVPNEDCFDRIATDLQQLRMTAGEVPYAEIVRRITARRLADGVESFAARPARTTVYDAFRTGRTRLNGELVAEIARALGQDEAAALEWAARCRRARQVANHTDTAVEPVTSGSGAPPTAAHAPSGEAPTRDWTARPWALSLGLLLCLILNLLGHGLVGLLHLSLYLDMIGTALAAIRLGPWYGVAVGIATNLAGVVLFGSMDLPFALVNAAGALVWGYGVRAVGCGSSLRAFFALNLVVALSCTVIASAVLIAFFNGGTGHAADSLTQTFESFGEAQVAAVIQSNLMTSVADKLLTGFVLLALLSQSPGIRMVRHDAAPTGEAVRAV